MPQEQRSPTEPIENPQHRDASPVMPATSVSPNPAGISTSAGVPTPPTGATFAGAPDQSPAATKALAAEPVPGAGQADSSSAQPGSSPGSSPASQPSLLQRLVHYMREPKPLPKLRWADWLVAVLIFAVVSATRLMFLYRSRGDAEFLDLLKKWDGDFYLKIAQFGYLTEDGFGRPDPEVFERRLAFFPGYPGLIRALSSVSGWNYFQAGLVLSTIFGVLATAGVVALAKQSGLPRLVSWAVALFFVSAPMGITMNMVYTESMFLAAMTWSLVALVAHEWWRAGWFICAASCVRLTSVDLVIAFALLVLLCAPKRLSAWLGVVLSAIPLVVFLRWANDVAADAGGYFGLQAQGWHSQFDFGAASLEWIPRSFASPLEPAYVLSTAAIVGSVVAVLLAFRRVPFAVWLALAGIVANVVLSDGIMHSRPRLLLPAVLLLALPWGRWLRAPGWRPVVAVGVGVAWLVLGTWGSVYMLAEFAYAI